MAILKQKSWLLLLLIVLQLPSGSLFPQNGEDQASLCKIEQARILPAASPRAMDYYHRGNRIWIGNKILAIALPLFFYFSGIAYWLEKRVRGTFHNTPMVYAVFTLLYLLLISLLNLPFDFYSSFIFPHQFRLSNQDLTRWSELYLKSMLLDALGGVVFLWIPLVVISRFRRFWWLITGALALPFFLFMLLIQPVYIAPLFNEFQKMSDPFLETKIQSVLNKAGIQGADVLVVNKSADTKMVNAYVTGFLDTKRIVFWDSIFRVLNEDEIQFVAAHEAAHYKLNHSLTSSIFYTLITIASLFLVHRILHRFTKRKQGLQLYQLPLLIGLYIMISFLFTPATRSWSRGKEKEADMFAIEKTSLRVAGASTFGKLQQTNLSNPEPGFLYVLFRAGHPPPGERVRYLLGCEGEIRE